MRNPPKKCRNCRLPIAWHGIEEIRDKKDAPVLAAAMSSKADVLITGDLDFFSLEKPVGFKILTAGRFLREYFKE